MSTSSPVAVVTGAGRGIGRAVAIRLSAEGYRVALTSRTRVDLDETARLCRGETLVVPADMTDTAAIDALFTGLETTWGAPAEVVVVAAGVSVAAPLAKTTDEQWQSMLEVNLTAPFRCIRRAVPAMVLRGHGRIVVIASVAAKHGEPYISAYTASKHGVLGVVRSAAAELASKGVTVNAVCPGYVDTPMTDQTVANIARVTGRAPEDARAVLAAKQPNRRLVTVEEVAEATWSCIANAAINGQGLTVDGGAVQS
ncbi:SDR family oxidoreductase [Mycobacterium sp. 21AC1]|uniref:SDR family NAD(P)-dependent oxidoreductase n=1 Tax=[Mycobacterium] appelbergii TaxID=2939269 RepID=UPI002939106D|nr:SDR family oxidoreductase [Mycobacterium sp. 21AC1]MDV3128395.1 SDR family oxidoreductase [Mycobacterium sp. 21AC1]